MFYDNNNLENIIFRIIGNKCNFLNGLQFAKQILESEINISKLKSY